MRATPRRSTLMGLGLALGLVLGIGACADEQDDPSSLLSPDAPALSQHDDVPPGFTPNGVPYRNPDYKHATGRSGEAELTARALMNMDGTTDVEVTTGDFAGTVPPHDMTKLQFKYLDAADEPVWADNQNRLSTGYYHTVFDGLTRHNHLQIQGNVMVPNASGKRSRTGVVTIKERVNLRPDLAVLTVYGPETALVNTSVSFAATIGELNGDVSATANCVYYVDGTEVARSDGIWVGEGDEVSCVMSHVFTEVGTFTVTTSVENVNPGDWDTSNNSASTTIEIIGEYYFEGIASAAERHYTRDINISSFPSYSETTDDDKHYTEAAFYGTADQPLSFPADFSATQSTGGTLLEQTDLSADDGGTGCMTHPTGRSNIEVCVDANGTTVNITHTSGWARYYTRTGTWRYVCSGSGWWRRCEYRFYTTSFYYATETYGDGTVTPLGADYTFDVSLTDANGILFKTQDPVVIPLVDYDQTTALTGGQIREWGKQGSTTFEPNP